jgi:hypothetical protein
VEGNRDRVWAALLVGWGWFLSHAGRPRPVTQ